MDLKERVIIAAEAIGQQNIDAMILFHYSNIRYFTDLRMNDAVESILIITNDGEIIYLVPLLDYNRAIKTCWIENIVSFPEDNPNYLSPLKDILKDKKINRIGIERDVLTYHKMNFLKDLFNGEIIPVDNILVDLRAVKTEEEINYIKKSAEILDKTMQESLKLLREGIRESEISAYAKYIMEKEGAEGQSFQPFVMSGENSWLPQRFSSDKKIIKGELVLFDVGAIFKGYCSDMTRTFSLGGLNEKQKDIFNVAYYAQQEAVKAIRPGIRACDIDKIARDIISDNGYGKYFPHLTGHGIGISIHEKPILDVGVETILKPNMVVTVEPGIYLKDVGAARVEDMVLVTQSGNEVLTKTKRDLI